MQRILSHARVVLAYVGGTLPIVGLLAGLILTGLLHNLFSIDSSSMLSYVLFLTLVLGGFAAGMEAADLVDEQLARGATVRS